jgi:membrane protease YdiL (CAAX protease family)
MFTGRSSLPLLLNGSLAPSTEQEAEWRRVWLFVWFSVTCAFIVVFAAELPISSLSLLVNHPENSYTLNLIVWLQASAGEAVLVVLAALAIGRERWTEMRRFLKVPTLSDAVTAVGIVAANWSALRVIMYAHDRVVWLATEFGKSDAPRIGMYFLVPQWSLFSQLLPAAFFEEVIYRGYLQPRFIRRYGILRGLVILGLLWGASHFRWDFKSSFSDEQVLLAFLWRPALCVALGLVLGWTRLRSGSILPAAVIPGISNVNAFSHFEQRPSSAVFFDIAFWGIDRLSVVPLLAAEGRGSTAGAVVGDGNGARAVSSAGVSVGNRRIEYSAIGPIKRGFRINANKEVGFAVLFSMEMSRRREFNV